MNNYFCHECGIFFGEPHEIRSSLGDDPWGAGPSYITEGLCPECGSTDIEETDYQASHEYAFYCENCEGEFDEVHMRNKNGQQTPCCPFCYHQVEIEQERRAEDDTE